MKAQKSEVEEFEIMDLDQVSNSMPDRYVRETHEGIYLRNLNGNDTDYLIEWERCSTPERILNWVCHISGKRWVNGQVSKDFVRSACKRAGIEIFY